MGYKNVSNMFQKRFKNVSNMFQFETLMKYYKYFYLGQRDEKVQRIYWRIIYKGSE